MKQKYFKNYIRKKVRITVISNEVSYLVRNQYKLVMLSEYLMQQ